MQGQTPNVNKRNLEENSWPERPVGSLVSQPPLDLKDHGLNSVQGAFVETSNQNQQKNTII